MVSMTLAQRNRFRIVFAIVLIVVVAIAMAIRIGIAPMAERLLRTQVDNQASDAINSAISNRMSSDDFDYSKIVTVEKDAAGTVNAIYTNIAELNRLKTGVLEEIDAQLESLSLEELSIPIGSVVLPELFSGKGPQIPVRVIAARSSDAVFHNSFSDAGINQTLHSITIDISVTVTVMTWTGTYDVSVDSSVVAAQTVIVGTVPTTYFGMEEQP